MFSRKLLQFCPAVLAWGLGSSSGALAQPPPGADLANAKPEPAPPPAARASVPNAPYSIPFQLRPAAAVTALRTDTSFAFYDSPALQQDGSTVVSMLTASYRASENISPVVRIGMVADSPPATAGATGFLNPVIGLAYVAPITHGLRAAAFLGAALPLGSGGGDSPDADSVATNAAGVRARSAMDNAMFAVNDLVVFPGASLAYVARGLTIQIEATVLQLFRLRGKNATNSAGVPLNPDASRTNLTAGLHLGYFFMPELSGAVELRHQRWLSTPTAVEADATNTLRDTTTVAFGPRLHFKIGENSWIRPALALAIALDDPLERWESTSVQLDVPVIF